MPPEVSPEPSHPTTVARRAPLLWAAVALLAGYILAECWPDAPPKTLAGGALFFALLALVMAVRAPQTGFRQTKIAVVWGGAFLIAGTLLAWAWHEVRAPAPPTAWTSLRPTEATLTLKIKRSFLPKTATDYAHGFAEIVNAPTVFAELQGRVILYDVRVHPGESRPTRGETLEVDGLLNYLPNLAPAANDLKAADNARFRNYVHSQGAWFELARGRIVRTVAPPSAWTAWLTAQHEKIKALLSNGPKDWEDKYGAIYAALLLGEPSLLSDDQRTTLTLSGEIYLFAVSGLHIAVLAGTLWWLLRRIPGLPHPVSEVFTLAVAWLYVGITGGTPSGQRAALMLTFYLLAKWLARPRSPLGAVVAAGVATLIVDPAALDGAGFELSFAVVLGLILYAGPFYSALESRWLPWRDIPAASHAPWQKCVSWLWQRLVDMLATSWTAVLCSAALMADFFGSFSVHVLWLNLFFFPLTCLTLSAGASAVVAGLAGVPPFTWFSWLANGVGLIGVGLMEALANLAPRISWLSPALQVTPAHAGSFAALAVLAAMLLAQPKNRRPRWWYFALPVVVLAVFAAVCVRPA